VNDDDDNQGASEMDRLERSEKDVNRLALYGLTVVCEIPAMMARYAATMLAATVATWATGEGHSATTLAEVAAVGPIAWSALALITPRGGAWWWRQRTGGRAPSEREREVYTSAMRRLWAGTTIPLPMPASWFVLDIPQCEAAVYGDTLMLSKGALELKDSHLQALLAHQLGHLQGLDAKLTVAVNRLMLKPFRPLARPADPRESVDPRRHGARGGSARGGSGYPGEEQHQSLARRLTLLEGGAQRTPIAMGLSGWALGKAMVLLRGGLGLRLTASLWGVVWREQEFEADSWAASIGQGKALADFLESHVLELDHPIPLASLSGHAQPPTEHRIDQLRRGASAEPPPAREDGPTWMGDAA